MAINFLVSQKQKGVPGVGEPAETLWPWDSGFFGSSELVSPPELTPKKPQPSVVDDEIERAEGEGMTPRKLCFEDEDRMILSDQ